MLYVPVHCFVCLSLWHCGMFHPSFFNHYQIRNQIEVAL